MSSTYAGNSASYPANLTLPTDGDKLRATTFRPGLEGLADRTAWLEALAVNVAAKVEPLANTSALKAILTPTDGMVRLVSSRGLYVFVAASGQAEADPYSFAPTDLTPGRWLRSDWNTVVYSSEYTAATANTSVAASTGFGDQFTQTITDLVDGDILHIDASIAMAQLSGATQAAFRLLVTNPTPTATNPGPIFYGPAGVEFRSGSMSARYIVTVPGTHTIAVQGKLGAGSTAEVLGTGSPGTGNATTPGSYIRTTVYR